MGRLSHQCSMLPGYIPRKYKHRGSCLISRFENNVMANILRFFSQMSSLSIFFDSGHHAQLISSRIFHLRPGIRVTPGNQLDFSDELMSITHRPIRTVFKNKWCSVKSCMLHIQVTITRTTGKHTQRLLDFLIQMWRL